MFDAIFKTCNKRIVEHLKTDLKINTREFTTSKTGYTKGTISKLQVNQEHVSVLTINQKKNGNPIYTRE